jgi:hypothetical protein
MRVLCVAPCALTPPRRAHYQLRSFPLQRLRVRAPQELVPPG